MELKPGYKQTEAGVIPKEWTTKPLLEAVTIATGQVSPRAEPYKSMVLVAPDHIESQTGTLIELKTASVQGAISGKYLFRSGDIVYSKIRPYLRKAFLADFNGLCSADMYPLTPKPDACAAFVLALLLGEQFSKFAESVSVRSGIPKINREELAEFVVPFPPLPEQRAIAAALSETDALLSSLDRLLAKKRDIKQAVMQQLLTGKQRLPGFSREWGVRRLGELGYTYGGLTGKTKTDFGTGTARYIPFLNIISNVVIDPGYLDQVRVAPSEVQNFTRKGDLFFNGSSETPEEVGMCSALLEDFNDVYLNSFCFGYRLRDGVEANGLYLAYYFRSSEGRNLVYSLAQGATRYNLSKTNFMKLNIPFPEPLEQAAIAEVLSDMDAEIDMLTQRRDKTRAVKQGMMQELLTGRTRLV